MSKKKKDVMSANARHRRGLSQKRGLAQLAEEMFDEMTDFAVRLQQIPRRRLCGHRLPDCLFKAPHPEAFMPAF
jgi:hypothetical protein